MGIALLDDTLHQADAIRHTRHRPWPIPGRRWKMGQTWNDLLFAHWHVPAALVRPHIPPGLQLDEFDGAAWIGVTPFLLDGLRLRGTLPLPIVSHFPEWNVRTYVTAGGKPGIWFFSLNTPSRAAVQAARRYYRLPYFHAEVDTARLDAAGDDDGSGGSGGRRFDSVRERDRAELHATYAAHGSVHHARPGSIEHFLTERYCLYTEYERAIYRAEIHHAPWPLQHAIGSVRAERATPRGIELQGEPTLMHMAQRLDVVLWELERVPARELRAARA